MANRWVYLVRHGEYDWDTSSDPSVGLTTRGRQQARLTGRRLRDIPVTAIYSSSLVRAQETAACISRQFNMPVLSEPELRECPPSDANRRRAAVRRGMTRIAAAFDMHFTPAAGDGDTHDVIVTHGNAIHYLVSRALTGSKRRLPLLLALNCSVSVIRITPEGKMSVMAYNDVGHLPRALVTEGVRTKPPIAPAI